jgi:hypothetical protein
MSVEARAFLRLLQVEMTALPDGAGALWSNDKYWTRSMVGDGATRKAAQPDYGAVGRVGAKLGYKRQAEYLRIDQIWYQEERPPNWTIEAYIEHENSLGRLDMTVRKLLSVGPGLKVLVTYPGARKDHALDATERLLRERHGTSPDGRIFLVFGALDRERDRMRLEGHEFDGLGRRCSVIPTG